MLNLIVEIAYTQSGDETIRTTPFQLAQWRSALKLELAGLTINRGQKVSKHIWRLMGQPKTRATKKNVQALLNWVEAVKADLDQQMGIER